MNDLDNLIEAIEAGRDFGSLLDSMPREWWPHIVGAYKGSLDAARALHDALLPGWWWVKPDGHESGTIRVVGPDDGDCYPSAVGKNANPARAWLIAILKAHRAQVQG